MQIDSGPRPAPVPRGSCGAAGRLAAALLGAVLVAGCSLGIGPAASPPASARASEIPSGDRPFKPTPMPSPTFGRYVVRRGDTLAGIADRFGTSVESLGYWNRLRYPSLDPDSPLYNPNAIQAGWTLKYIPNSEVDPENLPPGSSSAPSQGPSASPEPFPSLPANGSAIFLLRGPANSDEVAITFDYTGGPGLGASGEGADAIVQWLSAQGVPATVFVAPSALAGVDGKGVVARIGQALSGGTLRAGLLAQATDLAGPSGASDLRGADASLAATLGSTTAPWLRASGTLTEPELAAAGAAGWRWAIGWDVDGGDSVSPDAGGPIAEDILAVVVSRARGGSIVRLSLGGAYTLQALPGILDGFAAGGLRVVSLPELLGVSSRG